MSDDRVAGDGFHEHDLLRRVELRQKCLDAAAIAQEFRVVAEKSLTLSMIQIRGYPPSTEPAWGLTAQEGLCAPKPAHYIVHERNEPPVIALGG